MPASGLTSLVFVSALLSASPPAASRGGDSAQGAELAIEIIDRGAAQPSRFGFVVPVDGRLDAWVGEGDVARHCTVQTRPAGSAGQHVDLRCRGDKAHEIRVEVTRGFASGQRTMVAEVQRPGGAKSQVFVTLR
ncbi:MAG: hypothetical protein R3A79_22360 [Nannocystaceae bacterium]